MMNREEMKREMLSKVNVEAINAYISKTDSAATYDANVTKILEAWAENKVDIYVKFGRQLKIEKEVECNIPENQCRKLREDFIEEYKEPKYTLANAFVKTIKLSESSNNYLDRDYYLLGTKFAKGMRVSRCFRQLLPGKDVDDYQTKFSMFIQKFKVHGQKLLIGRYHKVKKKSSLFIFNTVRTIYMGTICTRSSNNWANNKNYL